MWFTLESTVLWPYVVQTQEDPCTDPVGPWHGPLELWLPVLLLLLDPGTVPRKALPGPRRTLPGPSRAVAKFWHWALEGPGGALQPPLLISEKKKIEFLCSSQAHFIKYSKSPPPHRQGLFIKTADPSVYPTGAGDFCFVTLYTYPPSGNSPDPSVCPTRDSVSVRVYVGTLLYVLLWF